MTEQEVTVVLTAVLAVGTLLTAAAALWTARIAARELRLSRLPILSVRWTAVTGRGDTYRIRANVKNISQFPVVINGYETLEQIGERDERLVLPFRDGIDFFLRPNERFPVRFRLHITEDEIMKRVMPLTGVLTLRVFVSVFGVPDLKETWTGRCHIRHNSFSKWPTFHRERRRHWVREERSRWREWCRALEQWKREMGG